MSYIDEILNSGVEPLELRYKTIFSCEFKTPLAYCSELLVNSVDLGVLTPQEYLPVALRTNQCVELFLWNLQVVMNELIEKSGKADFEWISISTPVRAITKSKISGKLAKLFASNEFALRNKICLAVPEEILYEDVALVNEELAHLHELGVKIAISGFGSEFCPITRLAGLQVDIVFTSTNVSKNILSKNSFAAKTVTGFARECSVQIILDGSEDELLESGYSHGCIGGIGKKLSKKIR